jgi:hypothetical protein
MFTPSAPSRLTVKFPGFENQWLKEGISRKAGARGNTSVGRCWRLAGEVPRALPNPGVRDDRARRIGSAKACRLTWASVSLEVLKEENNPRREQSVDEERPNNAETTMMTNGSLAGF